MHGADAPVGLVRAALGQGRLLLPTSSRRDALAGLTLLNPNRTAALVASRLYGAWIALAGPRRAGRSARGDGTAIVGADNPELLDRVRDAIGPFSGLALIDPRQADRPRVAMLAVRHGTPVAFVKVNRNVDELTRERTVLCHLAEGGVNVRTPRVIAHGEVGDLAWMATTAMSSPWTRPVTELPNGWQVGRELTALEPLLGPRPRADAVALHGDLTPWNLRQCAGEPWLLDWEDISWGPPGADEAYFHATATAVCGAVLHPATLDAVEHWTEIVSRRAGDGADEALRVRILEVLEQMAALG